MYDKWGNKQDNGYDWFMLFLLVLMILLIVYQFFCYTSIFNLLRLRMY